MLNKFINITKQILKIYLIILVIITILFVILDITEIIIGRDNVDILMKPIDFAICSIIYPVKLITNTIDNIGGMIKPGYKFIRNEKEYRYFKPF